MLGFYKLIVVFLLVSNFTLVFSAYRRNTEIMNIGWIWSLPYDISNTLRTPLGGPLSLVLSACLTIVMFFGMAVSPVYYLLGTPQRRYQQKDAIMVPALAAVDGRSEPRFLNNDSYAYEGPVPTEGASEKLHQGEEISEPNYIDHLFRFIDEDDENCKKLMVCHSHGFLSYIPSFILRFYRLMSLKTAEIPTEYSKAIQIGFEDQGECAKVFGKCGKSLPTLFGKTALARFLSIK